MPDSAVAPDPKDVRVLVVCLGNICRSPMGEAVLRHTAKQRGLDITVDSAGTAGYHVGEEPDERTTAVCQKNQVAIDCRSRQVTVSDFMTFTHILASDENNLRELMKKKPEGTTVDIRLWGSYLDDKPIADPYYGTLADFEGVFEKCTKLSQAFLNQVFGEDEKSKPDPSG